jgi:hypothetical protein
MSVGSSAIFTCNTCHWISRVAGRRGAHGVVKDAMFALRVVLVEPDIQLAHRHGLETSIPTGLLVEGDEDLPRTGASVNIARDVIKLRFQLVGLPMQALLPPEEEGDLQYARRCIVRVAEEERGERRRTP